MWSVLNRTLWKFPQFQGIFHPRTHCVRGWHCIRGHLLSFTRPHWPKHNDSKKIRKLHVPWLNCNVRLCNKTIYCAMKKKKRLRQKEIRKTQMPNSQLFSSLEGFHCPTFKTQSWGACVCLSSSSRRPMDFDLVQEQILKSSTFLIFRFLYITCMLKFEFGLS